jgi:hypothetical protein
MSQTGQYTTFVCLLDHLVGLYKKGLRHRDAERFCGRFDD